MYACTPTSTLTHKQIRTCVRMYMYICGDTLKHTHRHRCSGLVRTNMHTTDTHTTDTYTNTHAQELCNVASVSREDKVSHYFLAPGSVLTS